MEKSKGLPQIHHKLLRFTTVDNSQYFPVFAVNQNGKSDSLEHPVNYGGQMSQMPVGPNLQVSYTYNISELHIAHLNYLSKVEANFQSQDGLHESLT